MSVSWGQPSYSTTYAKANYNRSLPPYYNPHAARQEISYQIQQAPLGPGTSHNARTAYAVNYHQMLNQFGRMSIRGGKKSRKTTKSHRRKTRRHK